MRVVLGETVLVPVRANVADLEAIYVLNEIGTRVWQLLDGQRTVEEIVDIIAREYAVDRARIARDVDTFLNELQSLRLVERVDASE